jgi:subtilase family serine protease
MAILTSIQEAVAAGYITPPIIANYYNIPPSTGTGVTVGIISSYGGYNINDLQLAFNDLYAMGQLPSNTLPAINFISVPPGQTNPGSDSDGENTLDLYCVATMVPNATINFYRANTSSNFVDAINQAVNDNCDVISISYGTGEPVVSEVFGSSIAQFESAFANAAAKNITVLVSSGDQGSDPINDSSFDSSYPFEGPTYPASSANVIAVGGTALYTRFNTEIATQNSGGGISTITTIPSWQANADLSYTSVTGSDITSSETVGTLQSLTSSGYRGVPDISAPFYFYALYYNGTLENISSFGGGGTSAACPIMAGMIARFKALTGKRLSSAAYNQLFYSNPAAFYNSTFNQVLYAYDFGTPINPSVGYIRQSNDDIFANGYLATAGSWNPLTGLGRPIGNILLNLLSAQTIKVNTPSGWSPVANVYIKTAANTWSNVRAIYTKTVNGWRQTF